MNHDFSGQARAKLREIAANYQSRGYSVVPTGNEAEIPDNLSALQPDLVLRRGDETIVVELKGGTGPSAYESAARLEKMAETVEHLPNWRLELHWLGSPPAQRLARGQIQEILSRALAVREVDAGAALLLAWSAAEVALDKMVRRVEHDEPSRVQGRLGVRSARQLVSLTQSLGLISDDVYETLLKAGEARNRIAHGFQTDEISNLPDLTDALLETVRRISPDSYVSPDQMIDWFRENYEDPAERVPYDGREGGYQYVGDDPHDARDALLGKFPDADEKDIDEAVTLLESEAIEWVLIRHER